MRFEQVAPEDPRLDFAAQTPFVAVLLPEAGGAGVPLARGAARAGERRTHVDGRFRVEVSFGDFPWALRLTPLRQGARRPDAEPGARTAGPARSAQEDRRADGHARIQVDHVADVHADAAVRGARPDRVVLARCRGCRRRWRCPSSAP